MAKKTTEKKVEEAVQAVAEEVKKSKGDCDCCGHKSYSRGGGAVYGLGLIGALVYFIQHASSFSDGLYGVLKALFWPAVLIYKALQLLGL